MTRRELRNVRLKRRRAVAERGMRSRGHGGRAVPCGPTWRHGRGSTPWTRGSMTFSFSWISRPRHRLRLRCFVLRVAFVVLLHDSARSAWASLNGSAESEMAAAQRGLARQDGAWHGRSAGERHVCTGRHGAPGAVHARAPNNRSPFFFEH